MARVFFYLNKGDYNRVKDLTRIEDFTLRHPQLVWGWSTYFRLKARGLDVTLTNTIPDSGIVVMPAIYLAMLQKPPRRVLFICTLADSPPPLYMQVLVTQNPLQPSQYRNLLGLPVWCHIPHWPQPGIVTRDEKRNNKFETIAFIGNREQLDPVLATDDFQNEVKALGLKFEIRENAFQDYSDIDAVIAVRDFSTNPFLYKPFTKLVNGWMAKTPVIVGPESSFQSIKKSELDFLCVSNNGQLLTAIQKLKANEELRRQMVENGLQRMKEFREEKIVEQWEKLLFKDAQQYYWNWIHKTIGGKQLFYVDLFISRSYRSAKNKIKRRVRLVVLAAFKNMRSYFDSKRANTIFGAVTKTQIAYLLSEPYNLFSV